MPIGPGRYLLVGSMILVVVGIGVGLVWWLTPTPEYKIAVLRWLETHEKNATGFEVGVPIKNPDTVKGGMFVAVKYQVPDPKGNKTVAVQLFQLDRNNKVFGRPAGVFGGERVGQGLMDGRLPDGMPYPAPD